MNSALCGRDSSLFLFHSLGKVLYCKRDVLKMTELFAINKHLERPPLQENPEDIFEKTTISSSAFGLFLHQNYLDFMGKIETVVNCCSYFSDSDIISSEWNEQSTLDKYTASLTSRALMFYLYSEAVSSHKWRPFHKPQWYSSFKTHKEYSNELKYIFKNWRTNTRVLQTDILPYVVKIPYFEYSKGQKEFVRKAIKFNYPKYNTRPKMDNLTEKDIFEDNITEDNDYNCAVTLSENINDDAEENIIIEDDYS
ncbi:cell cycle checkpoint protein RAD17-like [Centruroides sculpturatus]|uniref:cell cycle checkpoint protein RAD17-like n=2 Tax=Centruroides sculpturatus TaxID=218467 RepID=UPI000C6C8EBC|nr:cell cycle checkpoint protein RAD17-like [Centruroides sculpturatus]